MASNHLGSRAAALVVGAALLGVLPGLSLPAHAAPSSADVETARNLMDVGRNRYDGGDYAGALDAFQGADTLVGVTTTGLWVGKALAKLNRLIEARDKLYQVSQIPVLPDDNAVLREARDEAARLQRDLADRIPEVKIELQGLHAGARPTIVIDGDVVETPTLDLPRKVDPGDHLARATAQGYHDVEEAFSAGEGTRQTITLVFSPNGEPFDDAVRAPDDDRGGISPLVWAGIGVAGAGVIVGAVTGGLSLAAASDTEVSCTIDEQRCSDDRDRSLTLAHVSTASFAFAGAGAVLMITGFIVGGGSEPDAAQGAIVEPLIGPTSLGLRGRF